MPFAIATPPVDLPDIPTPNIACFSHWTLDPLRLVPEIGSALEDFDLMPFDTLPLPDQMPQMKGRASVRPEDPLDLFRKYGDFVFCEGHVVSKPAFQDSVKIFFLVFPLVQSLERFVSSAS
jgi:hypothetical protein